MVEITFDYNKLNTRDKKIFDAMSSAEKERYMSTWVQIEKLKERQLQQKHASQERVARYKKVLTERERKERTHRLIERGAILEQFLGDPQAFKNDDLVEILKTLLANKSIYNYVQSYKNRHINETDDKEEKRIPEYGTEDARDD